MLQQEVLSLETIQEPVFKEPTTETKLNAQKKDS
jgi:hypothetical protein